jgi:bifunctional DNA-binding transcriptional regulator/antitoxin component of YhaV-PrlF toxin-antitoxin module
MPEKTIRISDKNRLTLPKKTFDDLKLNVGGYVLVKWDTETKRIEICPCVVKPIL